MIVYTSTEDELNIKFVTFINYVLLFVACKSMASQPSISGSNLSSLIVRHLNTVGVQSTPAINANRVFYGCAKADISIEKRDTSWKTIQLRCKGNDRWNYTFRNILKNAKPNVLLSENPKIERKQQTVKMTAVYVLSEDKSKGEKITKSDLIQSLEKNFLTREAFEKVTPALGKILKRSLKKGTILKKNHLKPDWLVYKNQKITIENSIGKIKVTMEGIALKNGVKGDRVLVRNISSNKTIEGFVNGDKKITIFRKIH